jgi:hypothetical protein
MNISQTKASRTPSNVFGRRLAFHLIYLAFVAANMQLANCQVTSSSSSNVAGPAGTVPLSHLYWHFLVYQNHLDQTAAQMEKEGKSGTLVRSFIQTKLNMSDTRFEPIHRASDRLSASLADLNGRAQHLRSLYIQSKPPLDGILSPEQQNLHDQLKKLNVEREELLTEQMNALENELTVDDRTAFREFLTKQIAPGVRVVTPSRPTGQPLPLISGNSDNGGGK